MYTSEKEKGLAGVELLISAFNFKRLTQFINDISQRRTNRSEWGRGKALAFKTIGRGFTPRNRFLFLTRTSRRRFMSRSKERQDGVASG